MEEKKLEILADHYADTHSIIRSREGQRDRFFLLGVLVAGFLALVVHSPEAVQGLISEVGVSGATVKVASVPIAVLASLAWTLLLVFVLRCYQTAITVDRQYDYLHELEDRIAPEYSTGHIFRREGASYQHAKPALTRWAWLLYSVVLPLLLACVVLYLLGVEAAQKAAGSWNWLYDAPVGAALLVTLLAYAIPQVHGRVERWMDARAVSRKTG